VNQTFLQIIIIIYFIITVLLSIMWFSELMESDVDKKLQLSLWVHTLDE